MEPAGRMRISTRSWHYRYLDWLQYRPYDSKSLCGYFWRLVLGLVIPPLFVSSGLFLLSLAVYNYALAWQHHFWATLVWTGIVLGFISVIAGLIWYAFYLEDHDRPRLLPAYWRAQKQKICPLITFEKE